ncbi:MAG: amino acid adenylation domain-containing protein [Planctomycetales bacterium]|nr:amino acid adenylation domain-containing protein [Planctomycetales bacterium]
MPPSNSAYLLTPLQQGMLFHSQFAPASGVEIEQVVITLDEPLNVAHFRTAWDAVVTRHAVLRTGFDFSRGESPEQFVNDGVQLDWQLLDCRGVAMDGRHEQLERFLEEDRRRDFALDRAPLMRLALLTYADDRYQCVWTFHHAILDGRSFPLDLSEVFSCYDAYCANESPSLAVPLPFRSFVEWLDARPRDEERRYWREALRGFTAPTPLPFAKPKSVSGASQPQLACQQLLSSDQTCQLQAAADAADVTLNTMLQAAWSLLLCHYSGPQNGTRDVVIGSTRACRHNSVTGSESIIGLLINTVPLRVRWEADTSTRDLLRSIRQSGLAVRPFEHAPLSEIKNYSDMAAQLPLAETLVVFETQTLNDQMRARGNGGTNRSFEYRGQTNFPLALIAYGGEQLLLRIEADSHRYELATLKTILGHLRELLAQMAVKLDVPVEALPYLTAQETAELLDGRPSSSLPPVTHALHERFEAQVATHPHRVALTFEDDSLTYDALNRRANQLAHHLRELGVGPDVLVGIATERTMDVVIGILAILKAGGAYVPIDLAYPPQRLAFMLDDCRAPVLLTQQSLLGRLPATAARVVFVDDVHAYQDLPETNPTQLNHPRDLAYVIYTSGSTGNPKGALITHENVVRLFRSTDHWFGFDQDDVWTLFHSYAFDFSVWEIWGALLYGGRLVVVPYLVSRSPEDVLELISRERVTVLNQTPSAFRQLIQADASIEPCLPLSLRYVVFGGEALEMQSLRPWFQRRGDQRPQLINMYGITETTVHVTYRPLSLRDVQSGSVIGVPIPDLSVFILNQHGNLVPVGVPGELHVGGMGLARGYLNRDSLTAERFIPHPFHPGDGERLYRTGDLGRFLPDRDIEYLGRIDHQVKIRGFRIELGEIESTLCEHSTVQQAICLAREDSPGDKRMVAYLVCGDSLPGIQELREHLKVKLPEYMVPASFVFLETFPLTNNGKIDRNALPKPDDVRPDLTDSYVAPRNDVESQLASIWSQVLRLERVGVNDNYFELGGDSIQSTLVVAAARKGGLRITPRQLFECPTIAQLAGVADRQSTEQQVDQRPVQGDAPLTPIQHWFFEQQLAEQHHYNQSFLFEIRQPVEPNAFRKAMASVEHHHDALRLRFVNRDGKWLQQHVSVEDCAPLLDVVDLCQRSELEATREIDRLGADFQATLDFTDGPIWRAVIFLCPDDRSRLLLVVHHLVVDGVSWRILLEDLESSYGQISRGEAIELPAKTTSFKEWSEKLLGYARELALTSECDYWRWVDRLPHASLPATFDSHDASAAANTEGSTDTVRVCLSEQETNDLLQRVPQAFNTQINDVLLTALTRSVCQWRGKPIIRINLEGHGREDLFAGVDVSRTVGWFTSIYPVSLQMPDSGGLADALKSIKEQLRAIPNRGIGYGVLRYLSRQMELDGESDVVFNYLGKMDDVVRDRELFEFASQQCGAWHSPRQRRRHKLEVNSMVIGGCLESQWTYSPSLHSQDVIKRVANQFLQNLRDVIEHCGSPAVFGYTPSDFPLCGLTQSELDQLVGTLPDIEDVYPPSPIQLLFLARAASHPDEVIDQWHCRLVGDVDVDAFRQAWSDVFASHPILRTSFLSEGAGEPLQVVRRKIDPQWTMEDWSRRTVDEQHELWQQLLREDHATGMALDRSPLSRFTLVRCGAEEYRFLWTVPALLLDGWSWPIVFSDLSKAYNSRKRRSAIAATPRRRYRDYIAWLRQRPGATGSGRPDVDAMARDFWHDSLRGFTEPTPLPCDPPAVHESAERVGGEFGRSAVTLDEHLVARLQTTLRGQRTTVGALIQAAWAVVLSRLSGRRDVVFGAAFSGRPTELPGTESIVGPFVNNLPCRVRCHSPMSLRELLSAVHGQLLKMNEFQFVPLSQIQQWSEMPWQYRMFESLVVVQNYVVDQSARRLGDDVAIDSFVGPIHTNFPLLLLVEPDMPWRLTMIFDTCQLRRAAVERWLGDLQIVLQAMVTDFDIALESVARMLSEPVTEISKPRKMFVASQNYVAPNTPLQKLIAQVWQSVIPLDRISIVDNLFDLGVHSLLVVQLHQKLQDELKQPIGLLALFRYPTILALSEHLDAKDDGGDRLAKSEERGKRQRDMLLAMKKMRSRSKP